MTTPATDENEIALCYLTHNHPDVISQILPLIADEYNTLGIDILVYDDSDDTATLDFVTSFSKEHTNVYYVDSHIVESGDDKMLHLLKGFGLNKSYKYIWPSKDRCFFSGKTLNDAVNACKQNIYDIVMIAPEHDRWELLTPKVKDVYTSPAEFFSHYGQLSTNWEAMIYKYSTMLAPIDWKELESRSVISKNCNFNQTVTVFTRLSEIPTPTVRVIHSLKGERIYSHLAGSMWSDSLFEIWIDKWVSSISSLPEIYDPYKLSIIRSETGMPSLFGTTDAIIQHHDNGLLTESTFQKYESIWELATDYPVNYVKIILTGDYNRLFHQIIQDFSILLSNQQYDEAYKLFYANRWLRSTNDEQTYNDICRCFDIYKSERNSRGSSILFEGTHSIDEILNKYYSLRDR